MWNLKNKINEPNRNKLIDTENKLRAARWEGFGGLGEEGEGTEDRRTVTQSVPGMWGSAWERSQQLCNNHVWAGRALDSPWWPLCKEWSV